MYTLLKIIIIIFYPLAELFKTVFDTFETLLSQLLVCKIQRLIVIDAIKLQSVYVLSQRVFCMSVKAANG